MLCAVVLSLIFPFARLSHWQLPRKCTQVHKFSKTNNSKHKLEGNKNSNIFSIYWLRPACMCNTIIGKHSLSAKVHIYVFCWGYVRQLPSAHLDLLLVTICIQLSTVLNCKTVLNHRKLNTVYKLSYSL